MYAIEAPDILKEARGGLLEVANVIPNGNGQVFHQGVTYQSPLSGHSRPVPMPGAAVAAPVLTAGATSTTGGTFAAGTYFWRITALTDQGETAGSNEVSATLALNGSQDLNWEAVDGATGYKLYRGTAAGAQDTVVAELGEVTTYTDTGSSTGAGTVPTESTAGAVPADLKIFDQLGIVTGGPFSVYRGIDLSQFERDMAEGNVRDAFGAGESWAVERAIQETVFNTRAVDITPTAGTAVTNRKQALGLLEQYAADRYSGLPLIHSNRFGTNILDPEVDPETWALNTKQGTPVANGGGYGPTGPGGAIAPAGTAWAYVSGQVNIWKGDVFVAPANDLYSNRMIALAEATYVPTVETFVAAILVGI